MKLHPRFLAVMPCHVVRGRRNPAYYGLPDRLRQARRRKGLSMPAASNAIGGSNAAAYLIERRQALPRIHTVERFAIVLGISPSWLAYGEGPENAVPEASTVGEIGQRLANTRKARGLSRQALGMASGLTGQTVANLETRGMMPRVDTVELLAKVLGVSAGWLGFGDILAVAAMPPIPAWPTTEL